MTVTVRIPTPMRKFTENKKSVETSGETVGDVIDSLSELYPALGERLCDENGTVRRFVNVYLNDEDVRFKGGNKTPVSEGDTLSIIPAIAGGHLSPYTFSFLD